jgi:predicted membrane protein
MAIKIIDSPKFTLIKEDIKSLSIGLGITLTGAALTYITEYVAKADYGQYTALVVAIWALLANVIRKLITDSKYIK